MEVMFRDKILTCSECGNQFVYTVGQQRIAYEENGTSEDPTHCPVCELKVERMGRRTTGSAEEETARETARDVDGYDPGGEEGQPQPPEQAMEAPATDEMIREEEQASEQERTATQPTTLEMPVSPNRPSDYRSGPDHPLYGRGGEQFTGQVKWFNDRKGFGFITLDNGIEIFVHYSGIVGEGYKTLKQGQRVEITVEDTEKGPQSSEVRVIEDVETPPAPEE